MLNCTVCGHDNFPFTSAYNNYDTTICLVEFCHQCGARITFECPICSRLHPLDTKICPVNSLGIEVFKAEMVGISTRVEVFKNLPETLAIIDNHSSHRPRIRFFGFGGLALLVAGAVTSFIDPGMLALVLLVLGIISVIFAAVLSSRNDASLEKALFLLWSKRNPGILKPASIFINSGSVEVSYDLWEPGPYDDCLTQPYRVRLINFLLNQAK